jgi:hypothetical protein
MPKFAPPLFRRAARARAISSSVAPQERRFLAFGRNKGGMLEMADSTVRSGTGPEVL